LNETLHRFPRRFSKKSIASMEFSHSLGQKQKSNSALPSSAPQPKADIRG
jgi:hypothetical protein